MNKREFLKKMSAAGVATSIPITALADTPYPTEKLILNTLKNMKVGDSITVIKISEENWRLIGNLPDRIK